MTQPLMAWLEGATGTALSSVLLHLSWQGALVGVAAYLALRLVGPDASVARYRIAVTALALLTLAPVGTLARRGGWLARTLPGWVVVVPERTRPDLTRSNSTSEGSGRAADVSLAPSDASSSLRRIAAPAGLAGTRDRIERAWRAAVPWLLVAWLMGALLSLARLVGAIAQLRALRRRSTIAPLPVIGEVESLARRLGITQRTEVRASGDVGIPNTFGALRPIVLVPRRFAEHMRSDHVRLVLAHELAHIARRDYVANLAQCFVEALLFFHPVVHWLSRIARDEREHCCDELAAAVAGDRREVARALVALEELVAVRNSRAIAPAATGGILLRRIERLVATATPPGRVHIMLSAGALAIAVALVIVATPASSRIDALSLVAPVTASEHRAGDVDSFPVVWGGTVHPGERLRARNVIGSIRVLPVAGDWATIRARVSGGPLSDLSFEPTRDAEGLTFCVLRGQDGRCDAEGYTWLGTSDEMHRATVDLVVELPVGASITAATFEGDLVLDGVSGDAEARTGRGAISARMGDASENRTLDFHTGAGEVRVALPPDFGGTLEARLSGGSVEHEMPLAPIGEFSRQRMLASLGTGGNRLNVSSGNGSLVLTRSP